MILFWGVLRQRMKHIGNVIKKCRNRVGLSRKDLSSNICCEKYLYMIEKGKRTPSAAVINLLGDKLGVDLFEYYGYLECEEPIKVKEIMDAFNKYRRENELDLLEDANKKAILLSDFKKEPWKCELELNRLSIKALRDMEFREVIGPVQELIEEMEQNKSNNMCLINLYILLSTCFQMDRNMEKSKNIIDLASAALLNKEKIRKYSQLVITLSINKMTFYYLTGENDKVIEEGMKQQKYENDICCHALSHHTLFYLAFANYQKGLEEVGVDWFMKALYAMLVRKRAADMYYLSSYEMFNVILHDKRIPEELVTKIKETYQMA